jgi:hypothetical protein
MVREHENVAIPGTFAMGAIRQLKKEQAALEGAAC